MADQIARLVPGKGSEDSSSSQDKKDSQDQEQKPEYVTKAEISALMDRLEGISRTVGKIQSSKKEEPVKKEDKESATLTERIKEIESDKEVMRKKSAREAIAKALIHHGCEVEYADKKARVAMEDIRDKLQIDKEYEVSVIDGDQKVSVSEYIGAYLKTDGRWLLPPKSPPNDGGSAKGSRVNAADKTDLSWDDYQRGKYDQAKMRSGMYNMPSIPGSVS